MTNTSHIENVVMKRVHRMRVLRWVFSNTTIAMVVGVGALWGIGREVWVAKVFANGPQDWFGHIRYITYAFIHTRLIVQMLVVGVLAACITLAREAARLIARFISSTSYAR